MNSKYKVGDAVTVKNKYDPGKKEYDYSFCFTDMMIKNYGGQVLIVKNVRPSINIKAQSSGDPYVYILEGSSNTWHSSMFEESLLGSDPKKNKTIHVKRKKRANINTKIN